MKLPSGAIRSPETYTTRGIGGIYRVSHNGSSSHFNPQMTTYNHHSEASNLENQVYVPSGRATSTASLAERRSVRGVESIQRPPRQRGCEVSLICGLITQM